MSIFIVGSILFCFVLLERPLSPDIANCPSKATNKAQVQRNNEFQGGRIVEIIYWWFDKRLQINNISISWKKKISDL